MAIEPNMQKIYLISSDDLSELFPDAESPADAAFDAMEGTQSACYVNGEEIPILATDDYVIIEDMNISDDEANKAKKLLELWAAEELFTASAIENINGSTPDDDYPMRVDIENGNTYSLMSYYPSREQMANAVVYIWSGAGYTTEPFYVNVKNGADNPEEALEKAVVLAEKEAPGLLFDVAEVEKEMAEDGHYDPETGDMDAIFEETYMYIDATMEGASRPYYILNENLGVREWNGPLA